MTKKQKLISDLHYPLWLVKDLMWMCDLPGPPFIQQNEKPFPFRANAIHTVQSAHAGACSAAAAAAAAASAADTHSPTQLGARGAAAWMSVCWCCCLGVALAVI